MSKTQIQKLISEARMAEALQLLTSVVPAHLQNEALQLNNRFKALEREKRMGILSSSEATIRSNQITNDTLDLLNQFSSAPVNSGVNQTHHGSGDNVAGNKTIIGRQINMGDGGTYIENQQSAIPVNPSPPSAIKILFLAALPDDQYRFQSEFDTIQDKVRPSIQRGELDFLLPTWDTDYDRLLTRLKEDRPHVLHYSGHGTTDGMCLINPSNRETQLLENHELEDIFEGRTSYLKLVFLSSCFSSTQAEIISAQGIYVLGIKETEIKDEVAVALAERFYLGFTSQEPPISIEKAIRRGCNNFAKTYTEHASFISLWKDGKETDYKKL
ncbi:MAG: CHAT domain-containing protein [Bacteroidia bacterium]